MLSFKKLALMLSFSCTLFAGEQQTVKANGLDIWCETFGEKENPALLLIMGGLSQAILWPTEFCERLSKEGFYVIRYDLRDTGYSSCLDYEKTPYNLLDMAGDAAGLLDALGIQKAHLCGLSMGGPIAELIAGRYPERALSATLMMTSSDFRPLNRRFQNLPKEGDLSGPTDKYYESTVGFLNNKPETLEGQLQQRLEVWRILSGDKVPFEWDRQREIHAEYIQRMIHPEALPNHMQCIFNSEDLILNAPKDVHVPTLVIQGTEDPIFGLDHGQALASSILGAKLLVIEGMGHVPHGQFYDAYVEAIREIAGLN